MPHTAALLGKISAVAGTVGRSRGQHRGICPHGFRRLRIQPGCDWRAGVTLATSVLPQMHFV
ncbi:hypothetical protein HEP81_01533 [Streptomyces griseofuscus]|uniref:Uncharacterized protein n=1 Tax=Streptomyces griseofuscus TaxID=146922 RepID=A0A7H1PUY2_9ACTN|nr:hypothetical protein HEP81_01533 [Streptomyces griseofuscus]